MELSFLSPAGAAVALVAVVPLVALLLSELRARRVRAVLGLGAPGRLITVLLVLSVVSAGLLVGAAAAEPVLERGSTRYERTDVNAWVVIDETRSMLAAPRAGGTNRLARARELAVELRAAVPELRVGVASLTDRVLPHLFPTFDEKVFAATVRHSIGIERPPPTRRRRNTTILAALNGLGTQGFFPPTPERRIAVVLSDFETEPFAAAALGARLRRQRVELLLVHVWNEQERIFGGLGDADYRPDPASTGTMARLSAGAGADAFGEAELGQARAALREQLGDGTRRPRWQGRSRTELAPWLALAAFIPVGFVLWRRNLGT
jgi:hypothetical protein